PPGRRTARSGLCPGRRCSAPRGLPDGFSATKKRAPRCRWKLPMSDTSASVDRPAEPAVAVVVPVRNEKDNVEPLIQEIAAALTGRWSFEVIYVNDGSVDDTEEELMCLATERPWPRQLR